MKLVKVEYIEESTTAIFFNVTIETKNIWGKVRELNKRAFLEKWDNVFGKYANNFKWSDNTGFSMFDDAIIEEMILQYEKSKDYAN